MGRPNLRYQIETCLQDNFRLHFNKHGDKHDPNTDNSHIIKSVLSKDELSNFARTFTNFLKAEGYNIKMVRDIKPEHCQAFIDKKISEGCTFKTLQTYQSHFRKFEKCIYRTFGCIVDYSTTIDKSKITTEPSIKEYSFTKEELDRIIDTRPSESLTFIKFSIYTGSRIQMCEKVLCRDVFITKDSVIVFFNGDKGGRDRQVEIKDPQFVDYCSKLRKGKMPQDRLFNIKKDSANQWLYRRCKKLKIQTAEGRTKSGNHSIRKYWAEERQKTHGTQQTMSDLGHSENRKSLVDTYIHSKK